MSSLRRSYRPVVFAFECPAIRRLRVSITDVDGKEFEEAKRSPVPRYSDQCVNSRFGAGRAREQGYLPGLSFAPVKKRIHHFLPVAEICLFEPGQCVRQVNQATLSGAVKYAKRSGTF